MGWDLCPEMLIREARAAGLDVRLSKSGGVRVTGAKERVSEWLPLLRPHRLGIAAALQTELDLKTVAGSQRWLDADYELFRDWQRRDAAVAATWIRIMAEQVRAERHV